MWTKRGIVFIICILGLFFVPNRLFGCHASSEKNSQEEKSCCLDETQKTRDTATVDCCNDDRAESAASDDRVDDCSKRCGEKSCRVSFQYSFIVSVIEAPQILPAYADASSSYARYKQPFCTDIYFSIWQPPQLAQR